MVAYRCPVCHRSWRDWELSYAGTCPACADAPTQPIGAWSLRRVIMRLRTALGRCPLSWERCESASSCLHANYPLCT